jgi:DNA anti-recombination protein RmuC
MDVVEIATIAVILIITMLLIIVYLAVKFSSLNSKVESIVTLVPSMDSNIKTMTAPAETLTQVTVGLQNQVGSINTAISQMNQSVTSIATQAQKIEDIGKKYEETELLTRQIHNIMIGSYEKGRSGENYLRNMMSELMKIGLVKQGLYIGGKVVEYGIIFKDGKILAIDSKVVATKDVNLLYDEKIPEEERAKIQSYIKSEIRKKVDEVCKYIDPQVTLPCAIMAVPDSLIGLSSEVVPYAVQRDVMIVGYSAVPQLIVYFIRIHGFYSIEEDVAEMKSRIMSIMKGISIMDEKYFSTKFEKPLTTLQNSVQQTRSIVSGVNAILKLENRENKKLTSETDNE